MGPSEHGDGEMVGVSILKHSPESLFVQFNVRACFRQLNKEETIPTLESESAGKEVLREKGKDIKR